MDNQVRDPHRLSGRHEQGYARYRTGTTPILESMGGFMRYDMPGSVLLSGEHRVPFNRQCLMYSSIRHQLGAAARWQSAQVERL